MCAYPHTNTRTHTHLISPGVLDCTTHFTVTLYCELILRRTLTSSSGDWSKGDVLIQCYIIVYSLGYKGEENITDSNL